MIRVRTWLLNAPRWALGLVSGLAFAVPWTLASWLLQGLAWESALVGGVVAGVVFGALMGRVQHRRNADRRRAIGGLSADQARQAQRAARRGPVPGDPAVRVAAEEIVSAQLAEFEGQRWWAPAFFGGLAVLAGVLAVVEGPWWWLGVLLFGAFLLEHLRMRRRLQRRLAELRTAPV